MHHLKYLLIGLFSGLASLSLQAGDAKDMKDFQITPTLRSSDEGYYMGVYGGANFMQNYDSHTSFDPSHTDFPAIGAFKQGGSTTSAWGYVGGIKGGYNFESYPIAGDFALQPALEAEVLYVGSHINTRFNYENSPGSTITAGGNLNSGAFMINGLVRFKTGTLLTPYLGSGIGLEVTGEGGGTLVSATGNTNDGNNTFHSDNLSFAVQGIAGCDYEIFKNWDLFTEYKYLVAIDPQFSAVNFDGAGDSYTFKSGYQGQHLITGGLKYNF